MWTTFIAAALSFAFADLSYALPTEIDVALYNFFSERAGVVVSPDNTCGSVVAGANMSYSCDAAKNDGGCCSQYGYCGNSTGTFHPK